MTHEKVVSFCQQFQEDTKEYRPSVYNPIIFIEDGELNMHLTSAQYHGSYLLIGAHTRQSIIEGVCKHYNIVK